MSRPSNCSKVSEVEDRLNVDRISSLPDDLLGYMLSFLPTKCAVGTSILSSRWRCLHMLTNCLSFDVPYESRENRKKAQKKNFKKFVYRVLLLHKVSPIKKFSLACCSQTIDDLDLHTWVSAAVFKGVEQLHLLVKGSGNALPRCLFSCQNIVELELGHMNDFRVPESIYLPNLKILHLYYIDFSDTDSFHKLFSACSLLQELEVVVCRWLMNSSDHLCLSSRELRRLTIDNCEKHFEVDAPNLAYLHYSTEDEHVSLSLKNTDCLITAMLDYSYINSSNLIQLRLGHIKTVCHVKELHLLGETLEYLKHSTDDHIPSYPNLVKLHLGVIGPYEAWKYVTYWLVNSPRLETVIFQQCLIMDVSREDEWPLDVALVPFSSCVKVIEVHTFRGYKTELALLKYLLENAEALQRLIMYKDRYDLLEEQELKASNELLTFPRASRTCAVHLRD